MICKARHSTTSSDFEKQVHKVELFSFFISFFSDCFLLNDPGALVRSLVVGRMSRCLFIPSLSVSHLFNSTSETHELNVTRFWTLLVQATSRGLNKDLNVRAIRGSDHTLRC